MVNVSTVLSSKFQIEECCMREREREGVFVFNSFFKLRLVKFFTGEHINTRCEMLCISRNEDFFF